jgi:small subunit ribosomal protein S6
MMTQEAALTTRISNRFIAMREFVYETMYIIRPDLNDEQVDQMITKYQNSLKESGAEALETQHRGKRRLAYPIKKHREGVYVQMNYKSPGAAIAVLERAMRLSEDVLRYMTVKQEVRKEVEAVAVPAV